MLNPMLVFQIESLTSVFNNSFKIDYLVSLNVLSNSYQEISTNVFYGTSILIAYVIGFPPPIEQGKHSVFLFLFFGTNALWFQHFAP